MFYDFMPQTRFLLCDCSTKGEERKLGHLEALEAERDAYLESLPNRSSIHQERVDPLHIGDVAQQNITRLLQLESFLCPMKLHARKLDGLPRTRFDVHDATANTIELHFHGHDGLASCSDFVSQPVDLVSHGVECLHGLPVAQLFFITVDTTVQVDRGSIAGYSNERPYCFEAAIIARIPGVYAAQIRFVYPVHLADLLAHYSAGLLVAPFGFFVVIPIILSAFLGIGVSFPILSQVFFVALLRLFSFKGNVSIALLLQQVVVDRKDESGFGGTALARRWCGDRPRVPSLKGKVEAVQSKNSGSPIERSVQRIQLSLESLGFSFVESHFEVAGVVRFG